MPEFENLEPFLDRKSDHITPVAPHSTPAHDFVVERREPRSPQRPRRKRTVAPDPAPVNDVKRLTTRDMEKAYREATKASRARKKTQDRRQGRTLWTRLVRLLSNLFKAGKKGRKTDAKPRQRSSRSSRPSGRRSRPQERGSKPKGQRRPKASGGKPSDGEKDQGPSRSRSRNRRRRGKPSENGPKHTTSSNGNSASPRNEAGDKPPGGDARSSGNNGNRNRRQRSRRNRKPSGNNSSNNQKSAE